MACRLKACGLHSKLASLTSSFMACTRNEDHVSQIICKEGAVAPFSGRSRLFPFAFLCPPTLVRLSTQSAYLEELLEQYTLVQACLKHSGRSTVESPLSCSSLEALVPCFPKHSLLQFRDQTSATPDASSGKRSVARCKQLNENTAFLHQPAEVVLPLVAITVTGVLWA